MAVSAEEESSAADMVGDMAEGLKRVVMVADMEVDGAKRSGDKVKDLTWTKQDS